MGSGDIGPSELWRDIAVAVTQLKVNLSNRQKAKQIREMFKTHVALAELKLDANLFRNAADSLFC